MDLRKSIILVYYMSLHQLTLGETTNDVSNSGGPRIEEDPLNMTVARNEPVTLVCKASGKSPLKYEWYKDGDKVITASTDLKSHRILLPGGSLFFLRAVQNKKEQDGGVYWCVASNEFGVAKSKNASLEITYLRDDFRVLPRDTDASKGKEVTLKCSPPKGHPTPVVRWKKDGEFLDLTSSNRVRIDDSGSLVIQSVRKRDSGRYQCSAKNVAATKDSRPVRLKVHEPPYFITRPSDTVALAGEDALLTCQVSGDPYPDVQWRRRGEDIDITKVKIVNGKGLRLENIHPSDEGAYVCEAKNVIGTISASAKLDVREIPVITGKPPANLQQPTTVKEVSLECLVTGMPNPIVFWTIEKAADDFREILLLPGSRAENILVSRNGALKILHPLVHNTGHYVCSSLNSVGSALSRSHLIVYDPGELGNVSLDHTRIYKEDQAYQELEEARLALLEKTLLDVRALPRSSNSIRIEWRLTSSSFIEGIRIHFRKKGNKSFQTQEIPRNGDSFCTLDRLEEFTDYEIFLKPYYKKVSGLSSKLLTVLTHSALPSRAPKIIKAKIINSTAVFIAWDYVDRQHQNGIILGYRILIQENGSEVLNATLPSERLEAVLNVPSLSPEGSVLISAALVNDAGVGPFAHYDGLVIPHDYGLDATIYRHGREGYTWLIALIGSFLFMLVFVAGVVFYYRRRRGMQKSGVYDYGRPGTFQRQQSQQQQPLWIDRRWNVGDYEKDSNSSEKKLLNNPPPSENEYAYIDRHKLLSTFSRDCNNYETPSSLQAPYATTDILRTAQQKQSIYAGPRLFPLSVTPMLYPRNNLIHRSSTTTSSGDATNQYYSSKIMKREARSCDDITERVNGYARPHHIYPRRRFVAENHMENTPPPPRLLLYNPYPRFHRIVPTESQSPVSPSSRILLTGPRSDAEEQTSRLGSIANGISRQEEREDDEEAVTRFDDAVESFMSQGVGSESDLSHGGAESLSERSQLSEDNNNGQ